MDTAKGPQVRDVNFGIHGLGHAPYARNTSTAAVATSTTATIRKIMKFLSKTG